MTYCLAWKKDNKGYLITDSAISGYENVNTSEISSFGEREGLYEKYYVSEGTQKLIVINNKLAVAYAGNETMAKEAIEHIKELYGCINIKNILNVLVSNYQDISRDLKFQLILLVCEEETEIFSFNCESYAPVDGFVDIGSGIDIISFSEQIKNFIVNNEEVPCDENEYIASIIGFIQGISIKHGLFRFGVGGSFFGLWSDNTIHWCKDIEYVVYDEDVDELTTVTVIARYNNIFSASDFNGGVKYFFNHGTDLQLENPYVIESVRKILYTSNADYVIFYSKKYNVIYFNAIYKWSHFNTFRKWIRRDTDKTEIGYVFDPLYRLMLQSDENINQNIPKFYNVSNKRMDFIPREEYLNKTKGLTLPKDIDSKFDYDVSNQFYINKSDYFEGIKDKMLRYRNILIIDYYFFCGVLEEKFDLYRMDSAAFSTMDISKMVIKFFPAIASNDFHDYGLFFIKSEKDTKFIHKRNVAEWIKKIHNCYVVECDGVFLEEYNKIVFEVIKNYYFKEEFFLLDKLIFCCDNENSNDIISYYSPEYNLKNRNPDILLIRNLNALTKMDGGFR